MSDLFKPGRQQALSVADMTQIKPTLAMFTIDCRDPREAATFYAELLGWETAYDSDEAVMLASPSGVQLGFGKVEGHQPPSWPDEGGRKQFHLDLDTADIPAVEARALELGATLADPQPGETWRVLIDPAGHPFCLANWSAAQ